LFGDAPSTTVEPEASPTYSLMRAQGGGEWTPKGSDQSIRLHGPTTGKDMGRNISFISMRRGTWEECGGGSRFSCFLGGRWDS